MSINEKLIPKYEVGDTFSAVYMTMTGFITSSTTIASVMIYLDKPLSDDIKWITCSHFYVEARGGSGYLNGAGGFIEYAGKSGYTITCVKGSSNSVRISVAKSSAYTNVSNNTVICFQGEVKLTFS